MFGRQILAVEARMDNWNVTPENTLIMLIFSELTNGRCRRRRADDVEGRRVRAGSAEILEHCLDHHATHVLPRILSNWRSFNAETGTAIMSVTGQ
jgi:hypothetical protein